MGQFSWLDCKDTRRQILDDVYENVYLLIPKEFGGGHILEKCYEGYGVFGGHDVYDLVAEWNKDMIPEIIRRAENGHWSCSIPTDDVVLMRNFYRGVPFNCELRHIGIIMACYDEDNYVLEYPIKITHDPDAVYEECEPSPGDPNQGWRYYEDDEWEE